MSDPNDPILNWFLPLKGDPERLRCNVCYRNLKKGDQWFSSLKKHLKKVHDDEFGAFELMVKAQKEKKDAIEKAQAEDILLKSQPEFAQFNKEVPLDDIKPTIDL